MTVNTYECCGRRIDGLAEKVIFGVRYHRFFLPAVSLTEEGQSCRSGEQNL